MSHRIVGSSGHIDHGKSALVRALTGTDPDRLEEEKLRGITIELGFAHLDLGPSRVVSFVDVPGHERFVRHMVAGATGIDAVLLVVAADEGVKPQTVEHLGICSLLGLRHGIVALTKTDLVDPELVEVAILELGEFVAGTFLEGAPILPVSSRTGEGLESLRAELGRLFDLVPERATTGVPRLPVDRSFVLHGFGTVVTGTLASGRLLEGEEIEVLPSGRKGRIRGLEVHGGRVREAAAGQRTAVNLQGLDRDEVPRGSTLSTPGTLLTTERFWARVTLLPSAPESLARGGLARLHHGTSEREARLRILAEREDGSLDAEVRVEEPCVLLPGDRFILRRPAPVDTVGGGVVLDVRPPRLHGRRIGTAAFAAGEPGGLVRRVGRAGLAGVAPAALAGELGLPAAELARELAEAKASGQLVGAGGRIFQGEAWQEASRRVLELLHAFHAAEPLRLGQPREELRARCCGEMPPEAWRALLEGLATTRAVRLEGERVALADHRVVLSGGDRELADRIETIFRDAALDPPGLEDALRGNSTETGILIVELLIAEGRLVRIRDGRLFHTEALETLKVKLREYARTSPTIDVARFKELAGVTRRNAIPLLEHLDAERSTRRVGNVREILAV